MLLPFAGLASFCFIGGAVFCYYVVFPPAFRFLTGYSTEHLKVLPAVKEYFSLSLRLLIAFGLIFELPILMVFLAKIGIVNVTFLNRHRKYAILAAFVIAAVVTPTPDIVNQCLMAFPLLLLYEVSIIAVWLFGKRKFGGFAEEKDEEGDSGGDSEDS